VSRRDFWKLLSRLQRGGLTILLATPYLDEAERCSRVALIHQGTLVALDAPSALRKQETGSLVEIVARPRRRAAELLQSDSGVSEVVSFGERLHASLPGALPETAKAEVDRLSRLLREAGVEVLSSRVARPSLEDVFIRRLEARS
jgi:ABC-2 type transport system ATP-binding protein